MTSRKFWLAAATLFKTARTRVQTQTSRVTNIIQSSHEYDDMSLTFLLKPNQIFPPLARRANRPPLPQQRYSTSSKVCDDDDVDLDDEDDEDGTTLGHGDS